MKFDIFFSICQTPVDGFIPSEKQMFENFFHQVKKADELGFKTAWVAETHLSCQIQKENSHPVIPHFQGEVGLNTDILQLAHKVFQHTQNIHIGSAIRNILCNGGPIAHAEAIKTFLTLHGLSENEKRKIHIGFASGRFPFSNTPYGIWPRNEIEQKAWPVIKQKLFLEATEIFLRLLKNEHISSKDITKYFLSSDDFKSPKEWNDVKNIYEKENGVLEGQKIPIEPRWVFEKIGVLPFHPPLHLLELIIGSHDPQAQILANQFLPCGVFNLSITPSKSIESTHDRMRKYYSPKGDLWKREYMPRTTLVFLNNDNSLSSDRQIEKARNLAQKAYENYWKAMEGTLDPQKINQAIKNTIFGNPKKVAQDIQKTYHKDDRLMLWFDFNNHNNKEVIESMSIFKNHTEPLINKT